MFPVIFTGQRLRFNGCKGVCEATAAVPHDVADHAAGMNDIDSISYFHLPDFARKIAPTADRDDLDHPMAISNRPEVRGVLPASKGTWSDGPA